jgi:hypothetical protein
LRCIAHYDNSAANPANPDPNATVLTGKQSSDEMFNGYFDVALADQDLTQPTRMPSFALPRWVFAVPLRLRACLLIVAVCGLAFHFVRPGRFSLGGRGSVRADSGSGSPSQNRDR